jgi:hypothetical protein
MSRTRCWPNEGTPGDRVLGALYGNMTKKTRPVVRVPNAELVVQQAARSGVALSVASIHSDFEWACRDLLTDALEFWESSFKPALGKVDPSPARTSPIAKRGWAGAISEALRFRSADEGFLQSCYSLLGLRVTEQDLTCLPLFDFFRRCRNRIIHQDGTAGHELVEFAKSGDVQRSFENLAPTVRRMSSSLPLLTATDPIPLTPQHAICSW